MKKRNLREVLDGDKVPGDVPHWIVEFHTEFDQRDMTPLEAVKRAVAEISIGHGWTVHHVRSGLMWSVCLGRGEEIEVILSTDKHRE
jgi:hypothetical protein